MSTILIGVDDSTRSEDAVAFGRRLAGATTGPVVVACAFPYSDIPSRSANLTYREALKVGATRTARRMAELLSNVAEDRIEIETAANPSTAHALHELAERRGASLVVVGSTHTTRAGRIVPGATAERLLHGSPCAVAVVPDGYREHARSSIGRIGVAYNGTYESEAALVAAAGAAAALGAEVDVIGVVSSDDYGAPALMDGPSYHAVRKEIDEHVQASLEDAVARLRTGVRATAVRLAGDPAEQLCDQSRELDLLVIGSRGYGPLRSVLAGGVSGRVARGAQCPVIVVPRGVEAPLGELFGEAAAATA